MHDTSKKTGWQYPQSPELAVVADGQRFAWRCHKDDQELKADSNKCLQGYPLKKDLPSDTDYYEFLVIGIPVQTFAAIGNAKSVQIQLGSPTFDLPGETILALHDFANVMAQK